MGFGGWVYYWKIAPLPFQRLHADCVSAPQAGGTLVCRDINQAKRKYSFQINLLQIFRKVYSQFSAKMCLFLENIARKFNGKLFLPSDQGAQKIGLHLRVCTLLSVFHLLSESGNFSSTFRIWQFCSCQELIRR